MKFSRTEKKAMLLDPFQEFREAERISEVRVDPITGNSTRILDFPVKDLPYPDYSGIIEKSREFCPFCPQMIESITPKFSPALKLKERYRRGEAVCFPNAFPYDENGAVVVISDDHYLAMNEFTQEMLQDALSCSIDYLSDLSDSSPVIRYQSINWNYMPLAGSSLVHPHLQIMASSSPTGYYRDVRESLENYSGNSTFWDEYINTEKDLDQRFIDETGHISWFCAFAPMGIFDILGFAANAQVPSQLREHHVNELAEGIVKILHFFHEKKMPAFNMSIYFDSENREFMPHLRICPRVALPPFETSEINYIRMLHNESMTVIKPENLCLELKEQW